MQAITKFKLSYVAIPVLAWAAVVLPVQIAGAADGGRATASVSKSVKQLKQQVKALRQQVAAIQDQANSPRPPGGPAGGDLTGAFPNPTIGPDAVAAAEIKDNTVSAAEITNDTITAAEIKVGGVQAEEIDDNAVGADEITNGQVGFNDLGKGSVGASELKGLNAVVSPVGKSIGAGQFGSTEVSCPAEQVLIAGGFAWSDNEANSIVYSAPSESDPAHTWVVRGFVPAGGNTLYAWATCLVV